MANQTPQITLPSVASVAEDTPTAIPGISISDAEATLDPGGLYAVEISGTGTWTFAATTGLVRVGGTFIGTLADINAALATAVFTPSWDMVGTGGFHVSVADEVTGYDANGYTRSPTSASNITARLFAITPANDPVFLSAFPTLTVIQDGSAALVGVGIRDMDAWRAPDSQYRMSLAATNGTLTMTTLAGLTFTTGDGTADPSMTFAGTLTDISAALATLRYAPNAGYAGSAQITLSVTDEVDGVVATGTGPATSDTETVSVTVVALNDAPHDIVGGPLAVAENSAAGTLVGTVAGQDVNGGMLAYALMNDAGGRFAVDNAGRITVADGTLLDFERSASHSVTVRVTDAGGLFLDKAFAVAVADADPEVAMGGAAHDTLSGGAGNDYLAGGIGDDVLLGGAGSDQLDGGDGYDYLAGGAGHDVLVGGLHDDLLDGQDGSDYLAGGAGNDILMGRDGTDQLEGGDGSDYLAGGTGNDVLVGGDGTDQLEGGEGGDYAEGGGGNDVLLGGGGSDYLTGGAGSDYLAGGPGADIMVGGSGGDAFFFASPSEGGQGTVADFNGAEGDRILIGAAAFGLGPLSDGASFFAGGAPAPASAVPTLLYDTASGLLSFDADGNGGAAAVGIATLSGQPALQASDILLV